MYKVITYFMDLKDKNRPYEVGETYPRKGLKVTQARLDELAGSENCRGKPLIRKEAENEGEPVKKSAE